MREVFPDDEVLEDLVIPRLLYKEFPAEYAIKSAAIKDNLQSENC